MNKPASNRARYFCSVADKVREWKGLEAGCCRCSRAYACRTAKNPCAVDRRPSRYFSGSCLNKGKTKSACATDRQGRYGIAYMCREAKGKSCFPESSRLRWVERLFPACAPDYKTERIASCAFPPHARSQQKATACATHDIFFHDHRLC